MLCNANILPCFEQIFCHILILGLDLISNSRFAYVILNTYSSCCVDADCSTYRHNCCTCKIWITRIGYSNRTRTWKSTRPTTANVSIYKLTTSNYQVHFMTNLKLRNPQTGQMVPPCMDIKPMEGWCLENSDLCTKRIEECHDLMEANTASVGTGNALVAFLVIAGKNFLMSRVWSNYYFKFWLLLRVQCWRSKMASMTKMKMVMKTILVHSIMDEQKQRTMDSTAPVTAKENSLCKTVKHHPNLFNSIYTHVHF